MVSSEVVIRISQDIERRLASLIQVASEYRSRIYITTADNKKINAKSLMGMMNLISSTGDTITVSAEGSDEKEALEAILKYLKR
ncbi:MAG: HPr family phosphocarrier protein [Eubacteriales bacterium]|nr:HPr family phosphocarrier protein [Eubacteriales bacterium]